ncbi:MAG: helix-turn-helix domain-containing protein [Cyanobacteria bacterium P01_D01_bin.156]
MAYTIKDGCISCDSCRPQCPRGAIKPQAKWKGYWIDPTLCNNCQDVEVARCVQSCDIGSLSPLVPKKGRRKSTLLPAAIADIFLSGKTTPFASSMVIWEACNVLAQRGHLPWKTDADGKFCYRRPVHRGRGEIRFRLAKNLEQASPVAMAENEATATIANFDIRATCLHLIFAAYAITLNSPWEESFVINDQHIEQYLDLDKRKDLNKLDKLTLIKDLVYQSCQLLVALDWPRQGKVKAFSFDEQPIWHLVNTEYYFEKDAQGGRHLIGLSFTIRSGIWAKHFLNKQDYRNQTAFYQYGTLPKSLLTEVMSNWQQHEGEVRLLLWLLFKLRLGGDHRLTIRTLLRIAYGEERLTEATTVRGAHKRLLKTFESDLETIYYYGLKPLFDTETYPADIQPLWAKAIDIPNDVDEALEFWVNDANQNRSLTDTAPRDKWQRLINARLTGFELSEEWQQTVRRRAPKRRRKQSQTAQLKPLSGTVIKAARQRQNLTQRSLAKRIGKSQSWVRDVEKGRFRVGTEDYARIQQTLDIK